MSGVPTRTKNKKNPDIQGKVKDRSPNESELTPEASMASFQSSLDGISKQIQVLQNEMKTDLKTFKDEITTQMRNDLTELKGDIDQKFAKITTDISEHDEKICAALTRTEELESWSYEANGALQDIIQEQKMIMDKLDNLESRSRRNNLRVYGIHEEEESKYDSVAQFMDKWLREEFSINSDLQIQRAHRALAPKPKTGQTPRSIIINFQQFKVKEMILKKAWEKKTITFGENRIYFDHDYSERTLQQRKAYSNVKKILKKEGIRFQTPLNRMRIHWSSGVKTYGSADEATRDLRERGYDVENTGTSTGGSTIVKRLQSAGTATWTQTRSGRSGEAGRRARERLHDFHLRGNNTG
ncbi:LINE-1 type transposase domain-containing protein 1 ES cell-associated protein 11 [Collichthys lucidus]|uniref:LINE-1 type transposase domain-containing protein 1 ES cell-associated protein 11 n=1 Tax=Collichthys lucidus TaxID=240159 RepID=A0A4U5TTS9_COLLU|nr:LINE-1 type transposase domain-containing protein 1 ES cell-associated protein 11 [Collichthys lucidus]